MYTENLSTVCNFLSFASRRYFIEKRSTKTGAQMDTSPSHESVEYVLELANNCKLQKKYEECVKVLENGLKKYNESLVSIHAYFNQCHIWLKSHEIICSLLPGRVITSVLLVWGLKTCLCSI